MRWRSAEKDFSAERLLLYADENLRKGKKMKERTKEIVNTADVEFTCQIGNAEFFVLYVSYPLPETTPARDTTITKSSISRTEKRFSKRRALRGR